MKNLIKIVVLPAILFLASSCNSQPIVNQSVVPPTAVKPQLQGQNTQAVTITPGQAPKPVIPQVPKDKALRVYEAVQGSTINKPYYSVDEGVTAYDLLMATHVVKAKDYGGGMGMFVEEIDGLKPSSQQFWEFIVNGKSSSVGASGYKLKAGDKIEWKLSLINNYQP